MKKNKSKIKKSSKKNRLWLARKRLGLGQKQVAYLLDLKTADQISRYEQGLRLPTLETALQLEIIYGLPLQILFKELYDELRTHICEHIEKNPTLKTLYATSSAEECCKEFCAFAEILKYSRLSEVDKGKLRDHITYLAKKLAYL
jgi:transcriptional regulator with XRE-family HTH domain